MWSTLVYTDPIQNEATKIRFMTNEANETHWVVLRDLLTALRYAKGSISSGLSRVANPIPVSSKRVEYTSYVSADSNKIVPTIIINCSGCHWFLQRSTMGDPAQLRAWLDTNIFSPKEIESARKELAAMQAESTTNQKMTDSQFTNSASCKFNNTVIQVVYVDNAIYFQATDIAEVFDQPNPRLIATRYVDQQDRLTIYRGQRPSTVLSLAGVKQFLNQVQPKTIASQFYRWLKETVVPALEDGRAVPDYTVSETPVAEAINRGTEVQIELEPAETIVKTYQYDQDHELKVLLIGEIAYFFIGNLLGILETSTETINQIVPAIWRSFQTITEQGTRITPDGQERKCNSKYVTGCLSDSGLYTLLEYLRREDVRDWITNIVIPNLRSDGYIPSNPYDLDMTGLSEREMTANDIVDPVIFIRGTGSPDRFVCVYNDVEIPIICNSTGIWFALGPVEQALDFPQYIVRSYPLRAVNFNVVGMSQVKKISNTEQTRKTPWQPYYIEYEGLKSFLAECDKPDSETFYLSLEDIIIPALRKEAGHRKEDDNTMPEDKKIAPTEVNNTDQQVAEESKPDIDVDRLLSDPDAFIRILKAYKATRESKADLIAENEALREYIKANKIKVDFAEALTHNMNSQEAEEFIQKLAENIIESGSQRMKEWISCFLASRKQTSTQE